MTTLNHLRNVYGTPLPPAFVEQAKARDYELNATHATRTASIRAGTVPLVDYNPVTEVTAARNAHIKARTWNPTRRKHMQTLLASSSSLPLGKTYSLTPPPRNRKARRVSPEAATWDRATSARAVHLSNVVRNNATSPARKRSLSKLLGKVKKLRHQLVKHVHRPLSRLSRRSSRRYAMNSTAAAAPSAPRTGAWA